MAQDFMDQASRGVPVHEHLPDHSSELGAECQTPQPFDATGYVVRALLLYALAEHQAGQADEIRVRAEGASFSVSDNGRGHSINKVVDGSPYLNFIYGQLDYPMTGHLGGAIQLQGIGMSLINSLCSELSVEVRKSDQMLRLLFRHGQLMDRQVQAVNSKQTGNTISGTTALPLQGSCLDESWLEQWLCRVAAASPSLRLSFNGRALRSGSNGSV